MKEERYYYSLTFRGSSKYHNSHDSKKNSNEPLTIGETPDCEIRYEQTAPNYEPEYYATILLNEDGKSWRIVKRSPHVDVNIAGVGGFSYVYNLQDGDEISFAGQKQVLSFRVHHDDNYGGGIEDGSKQKSNWIPVMITAIFALIVICTIFYRNNNSLEAQDLRSYEANIYKIQVDAIELLRVVHGDSTVEYTEYLEGKPVGTAFLTTDSFLVTARHCVEYWLCEDVNPATKIDELDTLDIRYIVAMAETYNYTHQGSDTTYVLRSHCSVYPCDSDTIFYEFTSTDKNVMMFKGNDDFLTLDDFEHRYYWRTITPYFANRKMELGDIMYVKMKQSGNIELADNDDLKKLTSDVSLGFYGYPENEIQTRLQFQRGRLSQDYEEGKVLVQNGDITHGNSGGPVFAKINRKCKVIGVVSKVDSINRNQTMSVPITEIRKEAR